MAEFDAIIIGDGVAGRTADCFASRAGLNTAIFNGDDSRFDEFRVPIYQGIIVLDALIHARDRQDPSPTFRHSCRMGVCGSDGLFINGNLRLGCQPQVGGLDEPIRVEPLPHMPIIKDLVVDVDGFYERMMEIEPYFQPDEEPPGGSKSASNRPRIVRKLKLPHGASGEAVVLRRETPPRPTSTTSGRRPL